jgi:hypothetical protein
MDPEIDEIGKQKIMHLDLTHSKQRVIAKLAAIAARLRR